MFPGKDARSKKSFEVNVRSVIVFREIGKANGNEAMHFEKLVNLKKIK